MEFLKKNYLLILILLLGLFLRVYKIDIPLLEFNPTRQIQTAEITKNLIKDNFNVFKPRITYDGHKKQLLPVEFPGYNLMVALFYKVSGLSLEISGRLVSIFSYVLATVFLYLIAQRTSNKFIATSSAYFFTFFPLSILTSRSFIPDEMMLAMFLGATYFLLKYAKNRKRRYLFFSMLLFSWAALLKIVVVFFLLPLTILLIQAKQKRSLIVFYFISVLPAIAWYLYANKIISSGNSVYFPGYSLTHRFRINLFFTKDYYSNLFGYEFNLIMLPIGIVLFLCGIFSKFRGNKAFLYSWLLSVGLYFLIFNVHTSTHEYYSLPLLPIAAIFIGIGLDTIFKTTRKYIRFFNLFCILFFVLLTLLMLPTTLSRAYKPIDRFNKVPQVGEQIKKLTKPEELIIGSIDAGPSLVYYSERTGWAFETNPAKTIKQYGELGIINETIPGAIDNLELLRLEGAVIFASAYKKQLEENQELASYLRNHYKVLEENNDYIIYNIRDN